MNKIAFIQGYQLEKQAIEWDQALENALPSAGMGALIGGVPSAIYGGLTAGPKESPWWQAAKYGLGGGLAGGLVGGGYGVYKDVGGQEEAEDFKYQQERNEIKQRNILQEQNERNKKIISDTEQFQDELEEYEVKDENYKKEQLNKQKFQQESQDNEQVADINSFLLNLDEDFSKKLNHITMDYNFRNPDTRTKMYNDLETIKMIGILGNKDNLPKLVDLLKKYPSDIVKEPIFEAIGKIGVDKITEERILKYFPLEANRDLYYKLFLNKDIPILKENVSKYIFSANNKDIINYAVKHNSKEVLPKLKKMYDEIANNLPSISAKRTDNPLIKEFLKGEIFHPRIEYNKDAMFLLKAIKELESK